VPPVVSRRNNARVAIVELESVRLLPSRSNAFLALLETGGKAAPVEEEPRLAASSSRARSIPSGPAAR